MTFTANFAFVVIGVCWTVHQIFILIDRVERG